MINRGNIIRVFEYERLGVVPNSQGVKITKSQLDHLYAFNDQKDNQYFEGIRDGVKFKNFVGVIKIGNTTIEILPKADRKQSSQKEDYNNWQQALLNMLSFCKHLNVSSVSKVHLNQRNNSLLELYFQIYLNEVNQLLHRGLIKQYRSVEGNLNKLKGRLVFNKHINKNLIHQERMYTAHQSFDHENIYNQILLKALSILSKFSDDGQLKDQINRIRFSFPEIEEIPITAHDFDRLKITRKTEAYHEAFKIAKMIILNYSPDIRSGQEEMIALLFDMNRLWEEYIYRMLIRTKKKGVIIRYNQSKKFWKSKTIRPDIEIIETKDNKERSYIIDTKWKIIERNSPADNDLKQMFAYNLYWNVQKSMLLFPSHRMESDEEFGDFKYLPITKSKDGYFNQANVNQCKLGFINVLNDKGELDLDIGSKVLGKLTEEKQTE